MHRDRWGKGLFFSALATAMMAPASLSGQELSKPQTSQHRVEANRIEAPALAAHEKRMYGPADLSCVRGGEIRMRIDELSAKPALTADTINKVHAELYVLDGANYTGPVVMHIQRKPKWYLPRQEPGERADLDGLIDEWRGRSVGDVVGFACNIARFGSLPDGGWEKNYVRFERKEH